MKRQQAGMTLIELVIVIIVLGIIAAVAAPKLADVSSSAKVASAEGSVGAFKSALTISQALETSAALAWNSVTPNLDGFTTSATGATVDFDGDGAADLNITLWETADCTTTALSDPADKTKFKYWLSDLAGATCTAL